eukprot:gb/GECH01010652.1/.p1 GENE.gb/GECH01010652.1/~~gb/GECH01010652.1/.p1  ORF type:complete len:445 (+),score=123.72 gb/GECH01010652.1/:1-1335(+)
MSESPSPKKTTPTPPPPPTLEQREQKEKEQQFQQKLEHSDQNPPISSNSPSREATVVVESGNVYVERFHEGKRQAVYPGSFDPQSTKPTINKDDSSNSNNDINELETGNPTLLLLSVECSEREIEEAGMSKDRKDNDNTLAFVLCGPNVHIPLSKQIVVLRLQIGRYSFVLPGGVFITFVFPNETPRIILEQFEDYISHYSVLNIKGKDLTTQHDNTFQRVGSTVAEGINFGGEAISTVLINGATIIGSSFKGASKFFQDHTSASKSSGKVFPPFRWIVHGTRFASRGSVKVSGGLVNSIVYVSSQVGKSVAQHTVCQVYDGTGESNKNISTVMNVGKSGIGAVGNVFEAFDKSTDIIFNDTTDAISSSVGHKFGKEHGDLTRESIGIATDFSTTYKNVKNIGVKPITKSAAKSAAKSSIKTVSDHRDSKRKEAEQQQSQSKTK